MASPPKSKFSQGEAAIACGYVKSKISQDMKDGTLSFTRLEKGGRVEIDASELIRVYGDRFRPERLNKGSENGLENATENDSEPHRTPSEPNALAVEVKFLNEKIALLERMGLVEREQLSHRIEEMKRSVEDARDQRDKAYLLLKEQTDTVRLLTDQRTRETAIQVPPASPETHQPTTASPQAMDAPLSNKRRGLFGLLSRRSG